MTPPPMIALTVMLVALAIGIVIGSIFALLDHFEKKNCFHFCHKCKYKKICDYYQKRKIDL